MKKFLKSLREHAMKIITLKKMKLFKKEQQESHENAKIYYIFQEIFGNKHVKDKKKKLRSLPLYRAI